ncbi:CopG family transcriptional regulator [Streptomyces cavourensis]|nr:CopG family transcriptional regulator [Streptomyces cavourensis]
MAQAIFLGQGVLAARPLANQVDQMASQLQCLHGGIMTQALSVRPAQDEKRDRQTQEALTDVEGGRVVDHQAVQAWADNLGTGQPRENR